MSTHTQARVQELIRRLDEAMTPRDDAGRCRAVKQVLIDFLKAKHDGLLKEIREDSKKFVTDLKARDKGNWDAGTMCGRLDAALVDFEKAFGGKRVE